MNSPYIVIIVRREIDRFGNNTLIIDEMTPAFEEYGLQVKVIDYILEPRRVYAAFRDPNCKFFISFNGFGTEIKALFQIENSDFSSPFQVFNKPVYDLFHDNPSWDWMAHQADGFFTMRRLLVTDMRYAAIASEMGAQLPRFVPSITYHRCAADLACRIEARKIEVLVPIGLSPPDFFANRFRSSSDLRSRVRSAIFDEICAKAVFDWTLDPYSELVRASAAAAIPLKLESDEDRFMISSVFDYVKFERRRQLLHSVSQLPVTVISDHKIDDVYSGSQLKFLGSMNAKDVLATMAKSKIVLCPTPHLNGFHERFMGAFSTKSVVVSSPNTALDVFFNPGEDHVQFKSADDARRVIEGLLENPDQLEAIAEAGFFRATSEFSASRLAATIVRIHANEGSKPAYQDR